MDIVSLIKDLGVPVAILVYLLANEMMRSRRDEKHRLALVERINKIEDLQRTTLQNLVTDANVVIAKNTLALESWTDVISNRPCAMDHERQIKALQIN